MRYLSGYERTQQMMGIGYLGEIRRGPDGQAYQWVQGVDGLGNPIGFWKKLKKWGTRLAKTALKYYPPAAALRSLAPLASRALPYIQRMASQAVAPAVPVVPVTPVTPVIPTAAAEATPAEAGTAGWGLGALFQAPDGRLYQVQGWGEADDLRGFAEDDLRGFAEDELRGLDEADDLRGLGALYQAPDGTLYRVQGLEEADDLRGFAEDELRGLDEADDLRGFAEDDLRGFDEADDLRGFAEDDLRGFDEADDLRGFAEDDLRGFDEADDLRGFEEADDLRGLEAYVPNQPAGTRWFVPPSQPPDLWRPLW